MGESRKRSVRRRFALLGALAAALGLFLSFGAGGAAAASSTALCDYDNDIVTIILAGDSATITKGSLSHINVNGVWCDGATTSNTETIEVIGNGANDSLTVDLSGGDFEPGDAQTETPDFDWYQTGREGKSDIEIVLDRVEFLSVVGGAARDKITVGDGDLVQVCDIPEPRPAGDGFECDLIKRGVATRGVENGLVQDWLVGIVNLNDDEDADIWVNPTEAAYCRFSKVPDFRKCIEPEFIIPRATASATYETLEELPCERPIYQSSNCWTGDPYISVDGGANNDEISGEGDYGTGAPDGNWQGDSVLDFHLVADRPDLWDGLTLSGGPGNDDIQGGDDNDTLSGGPGDDVIDGNLSQEKPSELYGYLADFEMEMYEAGSVMCAGVWSTSGELEYPLLSELPVFWGDLIDYSGSAAAVTVDLDPGEAHPGAATGEGTDVLMNVEMINGSPFGDRLSGDNNSNVIFGGSGDDTIAGDAGNDCEWGQTGNDTFDESEGTSTAQGGTGTNNGSDLMLGNAGADDTISYAGRPTRVNVYLEALPDTAVIAGGLPNALPCMGVSEDAAAEYGYSSFDINDGADVNGDGDSHDASDEMDCVYLDTENAVGGTGNDRLVSDFVNNAADNEFTGGPGNDLLDAGAGNDTFHEGSASSGADDMDGGTGGDSCDYSGRSNSVMVSLDGVDNDGEAGEGDNCGGVVSFTPEGLVMRASGLLNEGQPQSGQNVENAWGGSGADMLVGSGVGNGLYGNGGNDTLTGGAATDSLNGGEGDDMLIGGEGDDAMNGGGGSDTADYSSGGAGGVGVNVNLTTGQASGDGADTLSAIENVNGSSFPDALRGDANANVLNGAGGDDQIQAAAGDDTVNGGAGDDELGGGAGDDRVSGANGADVMRGGIGNDRLSGGNGPDTLYGGKGDDRLSGGAGKDWHGGGPGVDRCNPGAPGLGNGDVATGCER